MKTTTKKVKKSKSKKPCFATRLDELLEETNTTQEVLAEYLGFARQQISSYIHEKTSPDIKTVCKIADFFKVSTDYLLGIQDIKSDNPTVRDIHNLLGLSEKSILKLLKHTEYLKCATNTQTPDQAFKAFNKLQNFKICELPDKDTLIEYAKKEGFDSDLDIFELQDFVPYNYVINAMLNDKGESGIIEELYDLIAFMESDYISASPLPDQDWEDKVAIRLVRVQRAFMHWVESHDKDDE